MTQCSVVIKRTLVLLFIDICSQIAKVLHYYLTLNISRHAYFHTEYSTLILKVKKNIGKKNNIKKD